MQYERTELYTMEVVEKTDEQPAPKKAPRKPRPSEIAARKAKAAKKIKAKKKPAKKKSKPAVKAAGAKARKAKRPANKKKIAKRKPKAKSAGPERSERMDFRVTKAEKARVRAKAKKLKRTVTSLLFGALAKIK